MFSGCSFNAIKSKTIRNIFQASYSIVYFYTPAYKIMDAFGLNLQPKRLYICLVSQKILLFTADVVRRNKTTLKPSIILKARW